MYQHIRDNVRRLLAEIPPDVGIVAAAKARTPEEIAAAIDAGISIIGENYVKEAVEIFDLIETVDSVDIARAIDRHAAAVGKIMPVLIEVNIGREAQKNGVFPEFLDALARSITGLPNLRVSGLMTMGPRLEPEELRPYFAEAWRLYDGLQREGLAGADMRYLSMGMSDSYGVAIEEGANLVRLGTAIFGPRG